MSQYWVPQYKWQLVDWLLAQYPNGQFKHMNKKQLYAIYYKRIAQLRG